MTGLLMESFSTTVTQLVSIKNWNNDALYFFVNSNLSRNTDVTTMPNPGLTFRTIGGMLEFFVFLGPEPESVVKQYSDVIGRTFMPPYFALGFQLSRWGYKNTSEIRQVIDRTRGVNIPHVNTLSLK